ncbi:hypothetical protein [Rhodococcus sp. NPDC049939]|uniref:hypothetical protein n=1 Tax=Rhodococcus sp. NPDC049939 TaxID=3155511 RepID=UPI0033C5A825
MNGYQRQWIRWSPFAAVALAVVVLALTGVVPTWPGLVHLVALPPVDQFADLRILLLRTDSWPQFIVLAVIVSAGRIVVLSCLMGGLDRHRLRFATLFYATMLGPVFIATFLDATAFAMLYSRVFWPAVALIGVLVLTFGAVPWQESTRLRAAIGAAWRRGLRVEVIVPYCLVLLMLGALADTVPSLTVPLVPVSAMATGFAIWGMSRAPLTRPVVALTAAVAVLVASSVVFVQTRTYAEPDPSPHQQGSLLLMAGIDSESGTSGVHRTDVQRLGYDCEQVYYFSYAGPGDGQPQRDAPCPLRTGAPYGPEDTQRPVEEQVALLAEQTRALPRPLAVIAHSQAAWIAWEAVATGRAHVDTLVLVGAFPDDPIGYLPEGVSGRGRVFSDLLHWAVPVADLFSFQFYPDGPASRQLLGTVGSVRTILARPLPGQVRVLDVSSTADLPLMPSGERLPGAECPVRAPHSQLPRSPAFYDAVIRFLNHRDPPPCPPWREMGAALTRAFGVAPTDHPRSGR